MKKIYLCMFALCALAAQAQNGTYGKHANMAAQNPKTQNNNASRLLGTCNTVVINDTEEENGVFISGMSGQKAAVDIPIGAEQQITISGIKVTLASQEVPNYVHLRFYENILSVPEDPEVQPGFIPGDIMFDVNTEMGEFEVIGYEPLHQFYVRRITLVLAEPIVLSGNQVDGRYWMGALSNANAWATTAHGETGEGVVGESVAMGGNNFQWFQLLNIEAQYELTAECSALAVDQFNAHSAMVVPNPASDFLKVMTASGQSIAKAEIFNVSGQKVKEIHANFDNINVAELSGGVYILKAYTNEDRNFTTKFVKLN
ncbi:T9SS type A sorting domain-containing protein [Flavobacterium sp.]|uniref:T9SS type A sorting domain-containing protein n=1 Tax=Flavobacterium sp. TaxID=239 RepID=UPI0039E5A893